MGKNPKFSEKSEGHKTSGNCTGFLLFNFSSWKICGSQILNLIF